MALSEYEKQAIAELENALGGHAPTTRTRDQRWQRLSRSWWLAPLGVALIAVGMGISVGSATGLGETLAVFGFVITLGPSCRLARWMGAQHPANSIRNHNQKMWRHGPDDGA